MCTERRRRRRQLSARTAFPALRRRCRGVCPARRPPTPAACISSRCGPRSRPCQRLVSSSRVGVPCQRLVSTSRVSGIAQVIDAARTCQSVLGDRATWLGTDPRRRTCRSHSRRQSRPVSGNDHLRLPAAPWEETRALDPALGRPAHAVFLAPCWSFCSPSGAPRALFVSDTPAVCYVSEP